MFRKKLSRQKPRPKKQYRVTLPEPSAAILRQLDLLHLAYQKLRGITVLKRAYTGLRVRKRRDAYAESMSRITPGKPDVPVAAVTKTATDRHGNRVAVSLPRVKWLEEHK